MVGQAQLPPSLVYHLCGNDEFLREELLNRIRTELVDVDFRDFNFRTLVCTNQTKQAELDNSLLELPMLSDRRVLVLDQVQSLLPALLGLVHQSAVAAQKTKDLVLVLNWTAAPSKKGAPKKAAGTQAVVVDYVPQLMAMGLQLQCEMDERELPKWIAQKAAQLKLTFEEGAQQLLQERTGSSPRQLANHLTRLAHYCGADACSADVIRELVPFSSEVQTWRWTAALSKKNLGESYSILDQLLARDESPGQLLSYLNTYLVGTAQLKQLKVDLKTPAAIAAVIPRKTEYQIKKNLEDADSYSFDDLRLAFDRIEKADLRIKTGSDPRLMLQLLVLQICSRRPQGKK